VTTIANTLPAAWKHVLEDVTSTDEVKALDAFVASEREKHDVHPRQEHVFAALEATPLDRVRVVLVGQDPYPTPGHAHGLCFSVLPGVKLPGSLRNIYRELKDDLGCAIGTSGYLMSWAEQGVLMLNAVLTVRSGEPGSHQGKGWESLTDAVLRKVNQRARPAVFVLWGKSAQKKRGLIDESRHPVIVGAHPSPLSARLWFGSRPFSKINDALARLGHDAIDWQITA
jgi:uracil-DNA glycosylase